MTHPVSIQQERRLLTEEIETLTFGEPSGFNTPLFLRTNAPVNLGQLETALVRLIQRHSVLRSSFRRTEGVTLEERKRRLEAFQQTGRFEPGMYEVVVLPDPPVRLQVRALTESGLGRPHIGSLAAQDAAAQFRCESPPHINATVFEGTHDSLVVLVLPHLVSDLLSLQVIKRELEARTADKNTC